MCVRGRRGAREKLKQYKKQIQISDYRTEKNKRMIRERRKWMEGVKRKGENKTKLI